MRNPELEALISATVDRPVPPAIPAMAAHVRRSCGLNVSAILAYGSCLRGVDPAESLIDLYVLTHDYAGLSLLSRIFCRLVPPNVYYAECEFEGRRLRAKYAVLTTRLFATWMRAGNPYFWARFAQPSALLSAADHGAVVAALAQAASTMLAHARGLDDGPAPDVWERGFRATYATELRAEGPERAAALVAADAEFYETAARLLVDTPPIYVDWRRRRMTGKLWSVVRLVKAAFTFQGGADYIAWKIERHSGQRVDLSAWQRRHPILASLLLAPKLLKKGAIR